MQLSTETLEQFKKMYKERYKIQLTNEEAIEFGVRLIRLVRAVYGNGLPKPETIDTGTKNENN